MLHFKSITVCIAVAYVATFICKTSICVLRLKRKKSTFSSRKPPMINNIFLFRLRRDAVSVLANTILSSVNNYYWLTTYTYSTKPSLLRIYAFQSIHPTSRLLCALEHPYYTLSTTSALFDTGWPKFRSIICSIKNLVSF